MMGHRIAQTVAYADLKNEDPAPITAAYEQKADPVIEVQLEKAGVRLAYLLDANLQPGVGAPRTESTIPAAPNTANPDVKVWVNTNSGVYHCPGMRWFGKTREGKYMTQKEGQEKGYHPAANHACM